MPVRTIAVLAVLSVVPDPALGDGQTGGGEGSVLIGGRQAAQPGVTGSPNVLIGGKPAVTSGDVAPCGKVVVGGNASVLINGKPAATSGSPCK